MILCGVLFVLGCFACIALFVWILFVCMCACNVGLLVGLLLDSCFIYYVYIRMFVIVQNQLFCDNWQ